MGRLILVADDSSTIQKVIKIAFARYPVEIIEAASYIEALAATARSRPEVLIIDASLPGSKGPEDFTKLRQEAGLVPVLLLIGTYEAVDEAAFRQAGFVQVLKKPFDTADVTAKMELLLGAPFTPVADVHDRASPGAPEPAPPLINSPRSDPARRLSSAGPAPLPPASLAPTSLAPSPLGESAAKPGSGTRASVATQAAPSTMVQRTASTLAPQAGAPRPESPRPYSSPEPTSLPPREVAVHRPQHNTVVHSGGLPGLDPHFGDFTSTARTSPVDHIPTEILQMPGTPQRPPSPPLPPPPSTDESLRGRRAFAGSGPTAAASPVPQPPRGAPLASPPPPPLSFNLEDDDEAYGNASIIHGPTLKKGGGDRAPAAGQDVSAATLAEELPALVRQAVEDYCERHFKSLAREIIAAELRRLAEDKARHLVDN